jgi:hypothetical protein
MGGFKVLRNLSPVILIFFVPIMIFAQGVTTADINGKVTDDKGEPLAGANVVAVHEPTGTSYGAAVRESGSFDILNMKIGGPYTVTVSFVGYQTQKEENVYLSIGQTVVLNFSVAEEALTTEAIDVVAEQDEVLNSARTGAATFIDQTEIEAMPSIKRSTRDLIRMDPRNDGNYSFAGKNWLYNNISLDGSYFNNSFGLDDPAPGGQTDAEPVPFDAVEQVQVSVAPFDVREGGFTGVGINTVTKSGTNQYRGSLYSYMRNESFIGNEVRGDEVIADPSLSYQQTGFTVSGPIIENELFFFINGEIERREDPGTNFVADRGGTLDFGESRPSAAELNNIRTRMKNEYGYDTGPYEDYIHETNNEKLLIKLDWNVNENHNATLRYNYLNASRDLPPHGFVLSFNNTGRGPNSSSLPFKNAGYEINNQINSFAFELNSRFDRSANRFFASYNQFRDFRDPFSVDFPTIEIGEGNVTYTTLGHEPFSIHNILDTDVWQFTNNFSYFFDQHVITAGVNFEIFSFFNSFNIFRHGLFQNPPAWGGTTYPTLNDFYAALDADTNKTLFSSMVGTGPYKGEFIDVGQFALYVQDEFKFQDNLNLTAGLRVDMPMYFTEPEDNPFSRGLITRDENGKLEEVDQSKLPGATPLFSPRIGFNWDVQKDRSLQVRGGTGIFTGRLPFVWVGNVISNPGANPNLWGDYNQIDYPSDHETQDNSILKQSFDLNAMVDDFKWPQVWTTNIAIDHKLPFGVIGTAELLYGKDINAIYVRNADLALPQGTVMYDGRPFFGDYTFYDPFGTPPDPDPEAAELNGGDFGAGAYVIDNTDKGYNVSLSATFRKNFDFGVNTMFSYNFTEAKNTLRSTEIASVLFQSNPTSGNPNKPELGYSEFGNRHRFIGAANYRLDWIEDFATTLGLFFEYAEGNRYIYAGGNRYSFIYSGDVNGDGWGGNDLIYIPTNSGEINLVDSPTWGTAQYQWDRLNAFIDQDDYLSEHRGEIAERFGAINPWFLNIDLRIKQDFYLNFSGQKHTFQLSLDILNLPNFLNPDWGVRQIAHPAATSPLTLVGWNRATNEPMFNFTGPDETYIDDPSEYSRWRMQIGLRYFFN